MEKTVIGVDVGGTHIRVAVVDSRGNIIHQLKERTLIQEGARAAAERLIHGCLAAMDRTAAGGAQVVAVGLGVAGKIDRIAGTVLFSPNLPQMNGYALAPELNERLRLPVVLENDANAYGLGEHWRGAAQGVDNWAGLTLGTGVGGCLIFNGRLWNGDDLGFVGEIGHMIIDPDGPRCACGSYGCLEAHASGRALLEGVERAVQAGTLTHGALHQRWQAGTLDPQAVWGCAAQGDSVARLLFDRMGWALGIALANLFTTLGICHAFIGGGVSNAWKEFIGPLRASLARHCSMLPVEQAFIEHSELGDEAALLGAARLAWGLVD